MRGVIYGAAGKWPAGVIFNKSRSMPKKARSAYERALELREREAAEIAFQEVVEWWVANLRRLIEIGEISLSVILESRTPVYVEDLPDGFWPRFQQWVRQNAPGDAVQRAVWEHAFCEKQRDTARQLFSGCFDAARRAEHWGAWWHHETPERQRWWDTRDPKAWTIWRTELARMIADDRRGGQ